MRKAVAQADLVVVAMHAGAEGSAATHVPHGTETFLGENRATRAASRTRSWMPAPISSWARGRT